MSDDNKTNETQDSKRAFYTKATVDDKSVITVNIPFAKMFALIAFMIFIYEMTALFVK